MNRRSLFSRLAGEPRALRARLEAMGPTFVRVGLHLALCPDLIPQDYCDELMLLSDSGPPFAWTEARRTLEEELGDPSLLFSEIDPLPTRCGSLAQVYLAVTMAGEKVAVKILRPGIHQQVLRDLDRASQYTLLARLTGLDLASARELAAELSDSILREIDLTREAANIRRLSELTRNHSTERIPRVYPDLCTSRVLTSELTAGFPMSDAFPPATADEGLASGLLLSTLKQIFRYRFFNGDNHPANLRVMPDGVPSYFDWGLCLPLDNEARSDQIHYLEAIYSGDVEGLFQALTGFLIETPQSDPDGLHSDLVAACSEWQELTLFFETQRPPGADQRAAAQPVLTNLTGADRVKGRSPVALLMTAVLRAARINRYRIPANVAAMHRTLLTAETIAWRLAPDIKLLTAGREFFTGLKIHEAADALDPSNVRATVLSLLGLMRDAPGEVGQVLSELSRGSFHVNVQFSEALRVARSKDRRVQLVAIAAASVGLAVLIGEPLLQKIGPLPGPYVLGAVLVCLYVRAFLLWRRMR